MLTVTSFTWFNGMALSVVYSVETSLSVALDVSGELSGYSAGLVRGPTANQAT